MERKVIIIAGATATGKSLTAFNLAKSLNSEIISADSRQIYKFIDIGTAKPSKADLNTVKHHLIDFMDLEYDYNAFRFETDSIRIINKLHENGKIPVVVGGTGLYLKALIEGIFVGNHDLSLTSTPAKSGHDESRDITKIRATIEAKRVEEGNLSIYNELQSVDPNAAKTMLPQNYKRIIRALEVYYTTNRSILDLQKEYKRDLDFEFLIFYLQWDREKLYKRINFRTDSMLTTGLVEEVSSILDMGYNSSLNSLNTVGYKEIIQFLEDKISKEEAIELIKKNTRNYAKRQETWFRKMKMNHHFFINKESELDSLHRRILDLI